MNETAFRDAEHRLWETVGARPTERRVHLERNDVTVRLQEVGEGLPVVFVHGMNTFGSSWASLAARLPHFRCLLLDRPGNGVSDPLPAPLGKDGVPGFADSLVIDVLDALGLEWAHVVATSFGGYIGLRSAAAHADRIGRMVQFSCPAMAVTMPVRSLVPLVPFILMPPSERRVRALFRRIGNGASLDDGRITQADIDAFLALLRYTDTKRNERSMFQGTRSTPKRLALSNAMLAGIRTPTYFLWGENDPFGGVETARRLVDYMPNAEFEMLPGAGHAPWLDDIEHAAKTVTTFLGREEQSG